MTEGSANKVGHADPFWEHIINLILSSQIRYNDALPSKGGQPQFILQTHSYLLVYSPHPSYLLVSQIRYNDASPMENHHIASSFVVMQQEQYNFLAHLPREVRAVRQYSR